MTVDLELQIVTNAKTLPHPSQIKKWVRLILSEKICQQRLNFQQNFGLTIRIVDEDEMIELNHLYRNKNKVTNVLSFPADPDPVAEFNELGDVVICAAVVEEEAKKYNKDLLAHWALMVVHGVLHLLGFDHIEDDEAEEMEGLEDQLLKKFGV